MDELGLTESGLDRVIALSYRLLGLVSFLTAGPDEARAWTIPDGSTAVDAAGAIHTDLAKGFIRAETCPTRTCSRWARWPRRARPVGCAPRARPTWSRTATCWRSSSAADCPRVGHERVRSQRRISRTSWRRDRACARLLAVGSKEARRRDCGRGRSAGRAVDQPSTRARLSSAGLDRDGPAGESIRRSAGSRRRMVRAATGCSRARVASGWPRRVSSGGRDPGRIRRGSSGSRPSAPSSGSSSSSSSSSSSVGLELCEEVVRLLGGDVDGGGQCLVADEDEAVVALEDDARSPRRACHARSCP